MKKIWGYLFQNPQVMLDLERLNPGMDKEKLQKDYYTAKLRKAGAIALAGTLLAVMLGVRAGIERKIGPENVVAREDSLGSTQDLEVEAIIGRTREKFRIQVRPTELRPDEANKRYQEFCEELPSLIMGENASLDEIRKDLYLEESFEGYPFLVDWKSSDVDVIASSGSVRPVEEEQAAVLTAEITYGEMTWEKELEVKVFPPLLEADEKRHKELEKLLTEAERNSRTEEEWNLPETWEGEPIRWSRTVDSYSHLLCAGALITAVIVFFLADKDLHDKVEKRKEKMKLEYPDIVHKLVLYLGAGLTLRGSFQKIALEYEQCRNKGKQEGAAYEEMLYTCRELRAGVSEAQAYERFGKRTGLQEYIRLTTLLTQNLKKGSSTLLQRLREEAERSSLERIQNSRRLGEEASTKLLVPMVLMLAVVMVMVMLPALSSMGFR